MLFTLSYIPESTPEANHDDPSTATPQRPKARLGTCCGRQQAYEEFLRTSTRYGPQGISGNASHVLSAQAMSAILVPVRTRYLPEGSSISPGDGRLCLRSCSHICWQDCGG